MNYRRNSFRSSSFIKELATWKMYDDVVFFNVQIIYLIFRRRYYVIGVVLFWITWRFLIRPRRDILDNCFTIASWFFIVTLL